ncbi:MAG: DUF1679 domain-containing protein, partial [Verrucomicrobiaceae bacterium]
MSNGKNVRIVSRPVVVFLRILQYTGFSMAEPVRFQHFEVPLRGDGSLFELGRGAMGITYKAFDTNLRCFVALKVINATFLGSEVARERFLREARAAAALRHPNVATVFHLGEEGGDWFYAMEFVDGETVEAMMKREGSIPTAIALGIVIQVSRALGAAQKQGLVHRDIKPSNLMLVREDDGEFTVKVIDFGLAKNSAGTGEDTATLTMGGFLGTPHFASPEQLEERELDVRSDIYSLGVTLYYMLAGRAPFSGSLAQVMSQHLHREPPLETLAGQQPQVVALLRHMLAKDPDGRPQTPSDLRREAEACLAAVNGSSVAVSPATAADPENFETQVLDTPPPAGPIEPAIGAIFSGRYRIVREMKAAGRVFQAEVVETALPVTLLILDSSLLSSAEAFTRFEDQVGALQKIQSPAIQKILSLERLDHVSFLTMEWVEGPSLLDLMRARKALSPAEALAVLRPLASGFDALLSSGFPCPEVASAEVILCCLEITQPVPAAPAVKINALPHGNFSGNPEMTMVTSSFATLRDGGAFTGREVRGYVYALASLAYEMLGGVKSGSAIPIPGLSETANHSLRRALDPAVSFDSIAVFLSALESGMGSLQPTPARASAPSSPPPLPVAKSGFPMPLLIGLGAAGLLAAAGLFFLLPKASTPAPAPVAAATPVPMASPSPSPSATPTATPDPVAEGLARARGIASDDPAAALATLVALAKAHSDRPEARDAVVEFVTALRSRRDALNPGQMASLREPLEATAALDVVEAQLILGEDLLESDPKDALKWLIAAAKNGNTDAMVLSGLALARGVGSGSPDLPAAADWFQRAADRGDGRAMFALGECYYYSKGVTRDPRLALEWLNKAAEQSNVRALDMLGTLYSKGIPGVLPRDLPKAFWYFTAAKDLGFAPAYGNLGVLFMTAEPKLADKKLAVDLFKQGAEKGDPRCMYFYAGCLRDGLGEVTKDKAAAQDWYVKAAELGVQEARDWCRTN